MFFFFQFPTILILSLIIYISKTTSFTNKWIRVPLNYRHHISINPTRTIHSRSSISFHTNVCLGSRKSFTKLAINALQDIDDIHHPNNETETEAVPSMDNGNETVSSQRVQFDCEEVKKEKGKSVCLITFSDESSLCVLQPAPPFLHCTIFICVFFHQHICFIVKIQLDVCVFFKTVQAQGQ
jgi:hypothetical protein